MGRSSRQKGARGEREFRDLLRRYGFACDRDGSERGDLIHDVPGIHFEVKRRETLALPAWIRQAEGDAGDKVPVIAWRKNGQLWRVDAPAAHYLGLLASTWRHGCDT